MLRHVDDDLVAHEDVIGLSKLILLVQVCSARICRVMMVQATCLEQKKDTEARAVYTPTTSDTLNLAVRNTVKQSNLKSCMMLWIQL